MPNTLGSRPYLAFFRAGNQSLHTRILAEDPERNWDCCVNYFGDRPSDGAADEYFSGGENKYEGFWEFLERFGLADHYEYVLVLDDDLLFRPGDVSRYFDICHANAFYLSQPGLNWGSYFSHYVTLKNPFCRWRKVTFVEVMAPCFSRAALRDLKDTFLYTKSTWGIDLAWTEEVKQRESIYVIDDVPILHTRPIDPQNGAFYRKLRSWGISPYKEMEQVRARYPDCDQVWTTCDAGHSIAKWVPPWVPASVAALAISQAERVKRLASASNRLRAAIRFLARVSS